MDGFETAEQIRAREKLQNLPIIFLTAIHTSREYVSRGYSLGAVDYQGVLNGIFSYASSLKAQGLFKWYTMNDLAVFSQRRQQTTWQASDVGNAWSFQASNPAGLTDQTWVLPKIAYTQPVVTQGAATVTWDSTNWLVTAGAGNSLAFTSGKQ